jgi:hypothetical protein
MKLKPFLPVVLLLICSAGIASAQFTQARLQVAGINCALCSKTTERELKALPFISDVKPDLIHNIYVLIFKPGAAVDFDQIGQVVRNENFFISFLKATVNLDEVKLSDNSFTNGAETYKLLNPTGKALSGPTELTIVDKGLAPRSISKKYLGVAVDTPAKADRVYHLAI